MHCRNEVRGCGPDSCQCPCEYCEAIRRAVPQHTCGRYGFGSDPKDFCLACEEERMETNGGFSGH